MHTIGMLRGGDFGITVGGTPATFDDVFPGLDVADRFAFVLRTPAAGLAIGGLILAAITRHYEFWRDRGEPFWVYPDFYVLHAGAVHGFHGQLDIWPEHKEVVVADGDSESLIAALNDRAVTRLVVQDGPVRARPCLRETIAPALARIRTAVAFGADGATPGADVVLSCPPAAEELVRLAAESSTTVAQADRDRVLAARAARSRDGRVEESLRRIGVPEALGMLAGEEDPGAEAAHYGFSVPYRDGLQLDDAVMARHVTVHEPAGA
ncbi:hypothetical protein FSW04_03550 [Baekduia soli]|uniref:Uncharacterized protein n=1 Tax=Baekduia soli TaxID=496014 RepID=A0A5B8U185_9ACTN|nr:hypothetical protein [Baekduia soli]QEC46751.1 hypothetical protein FSW04_03550 [Baekduia soli]